MDADAIAIAKAAAAELLAAAGAFSQPIEPEYKLVPSLELKDLDKVKVQVRPAGTQRRYLTRSTTAVEYTIEISIRKHAPGNDAHAEKIAEEVILLAQEIEDWWAFRSLAGREERLVSFGSTDVYQAESLKTKRVIGANVVLVFRGERE